MTPPFCYTLKSILENIKLYDQRKNDKTIKRKLNLWFSLYTHFNQNQNRENMANKTVELRDELRAIIENENLNIKTDSQFAFASGQLIWKILIQSKSANRSHALLEPFLQKSSVEQFKLAIANTFDIYKHEFTLYPKKYGFDKLMGDVMGFIPDEKNMKNLLTYILAGYFSNSLLQK
jgi:CRISPR-associated protein Csh1